MTGIEFAVQNPGQKIYFIRGHRVMMDSDLAELYGVETKALNQAVRRNIDRFPEDFMFQLTAKEKSEVVTNCDHLRKLKYSPNLPLAFSEQGITMLSCVLNSQRAIQVNIAIMRAFVQLRSILLSNRELAKKLEALEQKYDAQFKMVFDAIRRLMSGELPEPVPLKKIKALAR